MNSSDWQQARLQASAKYPEVFWPGSASGVRTPHVRDLRHTLGCTLRAAGISLETRQALPGHRNGNITIHYSACGVSELFRTVEKIDSGARAPLLRNLQETCSPEMETGYRASVSR